MSDLHMPVMFSLAQSNVRRICPKLVCKIHAFSITAGKENRRKYRTNNIKRFYREHLCMQRKEIISR